MEENQLNIVQKWLLQTRANFLFLAVVLVICGIACAISYPPKWVSEFSWVKAMFLMAGIVIAHISVNLFNEYSDFRTRIDFNTLRNPFSGGSGMLTSGQTKPGAVLAAAIATLAVAIAIGVYFIFTSHWSLIFLVVFGAIAVTLYTIFFAKILLGEFFAGFALGTLVVLGVYISLTATPGTLISDLVFPELILISIPPGILTSLLLLLNEFPDAKADKEGGRFHLVIFLGHKAAAYIYTLGLLATYLIIISLPALFDMTYWILLSLLTLPLAVKAAYTAIRLGDDTEKIIPAMGINVIVVLLTDLLLAIGILMH